LQEFLLSLVLTAHLLALNLACAGPLFCIWLGGRPRSERASEAALGRSLAWWSLWALLFGIFLGVGWLVAMPSAGLLAALQRFPARSYWISGAELAFSVGCLAAYAWLWERAARQRWLHAVLALLSTTNLFHHFPPLMAVVGNLTVDPSWAAPAVIQRSAFRQMMLRGEVAALSIHFALASVAVAGVVVLWQLGRQHSDFAEEPKRKIARRTAIVVLVTTLIQLPVGVWLLSVLPAPSRAALIGGNLLASLAFVGSLTATFMLLQKLVAIALGENQRRLLSQVGLLLLVIVTLMTVTLRIAREERQPDAARSANEKSLEGGLPEA